MISVMYNKSNLYVEGRVFCPQSDLQLKYTLKGGQCYRWKEIVQDYWIGILDHKVWILSQVGDYISYKVFFKDGETLESSMVDHSKTSVRKCKSSNNYDQVIIDFFRLKVSIKELYSKWCKDDPCFKKISETFYGIRLMKQDPIENIFSFICSSNNFLSRISTMVENLCLFYGEKICIINGETYYDFPKIEKLAQPEVIERLRKAGFGFRAKYIQQSAERIVGLGGNLWINRLKELNYNDAKIELMKLSGIGAKVADCICLLSLNHLEAVPVDTHIFQISSQYYLPLIKGKSLSSKIYNEISDHFRSLYGPLAGWAIVVLFCADLRQYQTPSSPFKRKNKCNKKSKTRKIL